MKLPVVAWPRFSALIAALLMGVMLASCSTSPRPKPKDLGPVATIEAKLRWQTNVGVSTTGQLLAVQNGRIALANDKGEVQVLDASNGQLVWKFDARNRIDSGVGFDGIRAAVVTQTNQLMVIHGGQLVWQVRLPARSFTPPLLAGGRVFLLLADRSVMALDGESGGLIWHLREDTDPLVLQQPGLLTHLNNKLLVGQSARLLRINPQNGTVEVQSTLAVSRGLNDLERLIDLIAPASLTPERLCVVAFQTQLSCVNPNTGNLLWSRSTTSTVGLSADASALANVQENGVVRLWNTQTNQMTWDSEILKFRSLRTPILSAKQVLVADESATLYALDRKDGQLLGRLATGMGPLSGEPLLTPQGVLLLGRNGQLRLYEGL
ncbi:MAG: hypothetical protein EBV20_08070 [Betaproteobacteria bacterium]|jgi:outer membrane protein assembly factor BamB|nr:hypothetical protein [Betaproteobacteria bacterium]NBP43802.1 hypothetical protein [Betaproteobacteria bacterium]